MARQWPRPAAKRVDSRRGPFLDGCAAPTVGFFEEVRTTSAKRRLDIVRKFDRFRTAHLGVNQDQHGSRDLPRNLFEARTGEPSGLTARPAGHRQKQGVVSEQSVQPRQFPNQILVHCPRQAPGAVR